MAQPPTATRTVRRKQDKTITREKLKRPDYYRQQVQDNKEGKWNWAATYNFIAEVSPSNAKAIRDYAARVVDAKLTEIFKAMIHTNKSVTQKHNEYLRERIPEDSLLGEFKVFLAGKYGPYY